MACDHMRIPPPFSPLPKIRKGATARLTRTPDRIRHAVNLGLALTIERELDFLAQRAVPNDLPQQALRHAIWLLVGEALAASPDDSRLRGQSWQN